MTRIELIRRLENINYQLRHRKESLENRSRQHSQLATLIEDIREEGVLDVQCPVDIAETMNLPRPAKN